MPGPLDGVRVLEVASYVFVPAAGAILADWGADVLKVEHPSLGDPVPQHRGLGRPGRRSTAFAHIFEVDNRGKRAIGLDIATAEGRRVLLALVDGTDVFLTNLLPPARTQARHRARRHLGRNPRVVYGRGTAQGPRGPLAGTGGFDGITYWGRSGAAIGATTAGPGVPVADAGPRLRRPAVGHGDGRWDRRRPVPARAHRRGRRSSTSR